MTKNTKKNYDTTKNKLQKNWEDTQYLISLFNLALDRIKELNEKVDRLWSTVNGIDENS